MDDNLLTLAARLYYSDDLSQKEVAKILSVSQAKVSRMLNMALQRGIVQFSVKEYVPYNRVLEEGLERAYGLKQAVVIKSFPGVTDSNMRSAVGYFGAPIIAAKICGKRVVGVTGGRTLHSLLSSFNMEGTVVPKPKVVPLMGSICADVMEADGVELSRSLAGALGGRYYMINTPALVSSPEVRDTYMAHDHIHLIWELFGRMDLALVGVGSLNDSVFIAREVLRDEDLDFLRKCGAVGEICGRFYDSKGQECDTDFRKRVVSIGLEELRRIPSVIGVTHGTNRAAAVHVALSSGLINSLVIDEQGATAVLLHATSEAALKDRKDSHAGD